MYLETVGESSATYNIDDLSVTFVHMEGLVDELVVGEEIQGSWEAGSEILVTSKDLGWQNQFVRTIDNVRRFGVGEHVVIELDSPIPRPTTTKDSDFGVEVALLSRNIVFEGSLEQGGHLTIFNTPGVKQVVEGVEFRNFGSLDDESKKYVSVGVPCSDQESRRLTDVGTLSQSYSRLQRTSQDPLSQKTQFGAPIEAALPLQRLVMF